MGLLLPEGQIIPGDGGDAIGIGPGQEGILRRLIHQRHGRELHAHGRAGRPLGHQEAEQILSIVVAHAAAFIKLQHIRVFRRNLGIQPGRHLGIPGPQLFRPGQQRAVHQRPGRGLGVDLHEQMIGPLRIHFALEKIDHVARAQLNLLIICHEKHVLWRHALKGGLRMGNAHMLLIPASFCVCSPDFYCHSMPA